MRGKKFLFIALMSVALLCSCSTERRALNQMRNLTVTIEKRGDYYEPRDWEKAYDKYKKIDEKMDTSKLTHEEQQEYGELKGRCVNKFARSSVKRVVDGVARYINEGAGFLKGVLNGIIE